MIDMVLDASSLYARAFFASDKSRRFSQYSDDIEASTSEVGIKMLLGILDPLGERLGKRIDRLLFCWDGEGRRDKNRQPKPHDYEAGKKVFIQVVKDLFGGAHCQPHGAEADDSVATFVYRTEVSADRQLIIVSGDKDLQQLQSKHVDYYDLVHSRLLTREEILARWNVKRPIQVCVALAILGDPGDNIQGVHGWGPKRVEKVFQNVTADMDLEQVIETVEAELPPESVNDFRESLTLTILDPGIQGVVEPLPLSFASTQLVHVLGLSKLAGRYLQVKQAYDDNGPNGSEDESGELQDTDLMPFGDHRGTPMSDVPAKYFHWLWTHGKKSDMDCPVARYIKRSISALKQEHPDGLWD